MSDQNTITDTKTLFDKLLEEQTKDGDDGFISAYLKLPKPYSLGYQVDAFLDEEKYADSDKKKFAFKKKMELYDGVSSTFYFDTSGEASIHIDVNKEAEIFRAEVMVNNLGMVEYIHEGREGSIGDGWYESERFLFRLYLPPSTVRDIIEKTIRYDKKFTSKNEDELDENQITMRLDFVIHNEIRNWGRGEKISYEIKRLYI